MSLILLCVLFISQCFNFVVGLYVFYLWVVFIVFPIFFLWFITMLAETNRTPFDLAEGESELVSGFNTEYSSGPFALIFIAEYTSILAISMFTSSLFTSSTILGPIRDFFSALKVVMIGFLFI